MAEMTPKEPHSGGSSAGGVILGGVLGLILAVVLSVFGLMVSGIWDNTSPGACGGGIVTGIALLAVSAGLGWLAWYMLFRNGSRSFGASFLRGLSVVVAFYLLIPWPCSYTFAAFMRISSACRH